MAAKAEPKRGKLRRIEIEVKNEGGFSLRHHHEAPSVSRDAKSVTWEGMDNKPGESSHTDSEEMLDKVHGLIAAHEGKSGKKKSEKRVHGANILARKGSKAEEEAEGEEG